MDSLPRENITSNRLSWSLLVGPIPEGMYVLHRCDVRDCCNPSHLFLGTHLDNLEDMNKKGRRGKTGGRYNTKLTKENVEYIKKNLGSKTHSELSEMFGVSRPTITLINNKRTWNE